jgi:hypothetical protein
LVYYRAQGARHDRLASYSIMHNAR